MDEALGPIPEEEVVENKEGEEKVEPVIPSKDFPLTLCNLKWYSLTLQADIQTILNTIVSEQRRPKVAKGVRDTDPI